MQSNAAGVWACSEGAAIGIILPLLLPLLSIKGLTIRVPVLKVIVAMEAGTSVVTRDLGSARSGRGRPRLEVDRNRLEFLRGLNFTWSEISTILGVSAKTLRRRAKDSLIYKYTLLSDSEIDGLIRAVLSEFPRSGEVMLSGHLKARCINVRRLQLRENIHRVRGRTPLAPCIERRSYSVPGPNYLWHADGNHKLIKYRLVVHGAIDGFSRLITYLRCSDNNRASTVLDCFLDGVSEYGMPARIRTDRAERMWTFGNIWLIYGVKITTPILLEVVYTIVELNVCGGM